MVDLENRVKQLLADKISNPFLNFCYLGFAKEIFKIHKTHKGETLIKEAEITRNKWASRGFDLDLLNSIVGLFGISLPAITPPPPPPSPPAYYSPVIVGFGEAGFVIPNGAYGRHLPFSSSRFFSVGMPIPYDGVALDIRVYVNSNSLNSDAIVKVYKNETETDLNVIIPSGQAGDFSNFNPVSFSKGDRLAFMIDTTASTSGDIDIVSIDITYYITTNELKAIAGFSHFSWVINAGETSQHQLFSNSVGSGKGVPIPFKCLLKNVCVYVLDNTLDSDCYIDIRKNETTIASIVYNPGQTGLTKVDFSIFPESLFNEGDRLDFTAYNSALSGDIAITGITVELAPQDNIIYPIGIIGFGEAGYVINYNTIDQHQPFSNARGSSKGLSLPIDGVAKKLKVYVNSNSLDGTTYIRCRKNEGEAYIEVQIPPGGVGLFENNIDTLQFIAGDRIDFTVETLNSTTGSIDIVAITVAFEKPS
jgi:hypothetical protein